MTNEVINVSLLGVIGGAVILGGAMYSTSRYRDTEVQKAKIQAGLELKVGDYNGNPLLDKYYEINGQKVPVEVDGKPIAEYFKK